MDGVQELRDKRGTERVSFNDVADHLVDFVDRHPEAGAAVDALARFVARVEKVPHDHENDPERGLAGTPESRVPEV